MSAATVVMLAVCGVPFIVLLVLIALDPANLRGDK